MSETCTVLTQNNSYKLDAVYVSLIRDARERGDASVSVIPRCECGAADTSSIELKLHDVVSVISHGLVVRSDEATNVIQFRR